MPDLKYDPINEVYTNPHGLEIPAVVYLNMKPSDILYVLEARSLDHFWRLTFHRLRSYAYKRRDLLTLDHPQGYGWNLVAHMTDDDIRHILGAEALESVHTFHFVTIRVDVRFVRTEITPEFCIA